MQQEQSKELFMDLDEICSALVDSEAWHAKASNECNGLGVKGWAEWHKKESLIHKKCLDKLTGLLQDKLEFAPQLDLKRLESIDKFQINNLKDFVNHHHEWIEREENFNEILKPSLKASKKVNRELHKQLEKLEEEAQSQIFLVKNTYKRIKFAEFMPHDIAVCSKWIQDYFDYEYCPGDKICFNIG